MFLNNFDVLRLSLACLVYFGHWNLLTEQNISYKIFHMETLAVEMFFILSGFLIFWSFDADQNKKHFYIKRFFRIFPLYFLLIFLQTVFFIIFSDAIFDEIIKYFISNIFFLNFLSQSAGTVFSQLYSDAINGSLWTLKNELAFYILVPLIFTLHKKWGGQVLIILYIMSVLYMIGAYYLDIPKLLVLFPAQLRLFVVGIALYIIFDRLNNKNIYPLIFISFVLLILFGNNSYFKFSLYPICIGFILIYLVYFVKHIKINFDFSYSFYILHFPVIQLALYFEINPNNPWISFLSLFSVILILSYFSEIYVEKKFINIGRTIVKKFRNNYMKEINEFK